MFQESFYFGRTCPEYRSTEMSYNGTSKKCLTVSQEYFVSGFNVILPTVAKDLSIPPATSTWPANAFSLVVSAFLLPSGRMAGMYSVLNPQYNEGFLG